MREISIKHVLAIDCVIKVNKFGNFKYRILLHLFLWNANNGLIIIMDGFISINTNHNYSITVNNTVNSSILTCVLRGLTVPPEDPSHDAGTSIDSKKILKLVLTWWSMRIFFTNFKCFKELRKCVSDIILWKNIRSYWDRNYIETFQPYLMISVIFKKIPKINKKVTWFPLSVGDNAIF